MTAGRDKGKTMTTVGKVVIALFAGFIVGSAILLLTIILVDEVWGLLALERYGVLTALILGLLAGTSVSWFCLKRLMSRGSH